MVHSMTGFGRGEAVSPGRRITVDIRSINNRYCDIQVRLPRSIGSLESRIRQAVSDRFSRGKVDVYVSSEDSREENKTVSYDVTLAKAYADALRQISRAIGSVDEVSLTHITRYPDIVSVETAQVDPEEYWLLLEKALNLALDDILSMKAMEGGKLADDILIKVGSLEQSRDALIERAPCVPDDYRKRLDVRIDDLLGERRADIMEPARLAGEIALFADKCAIDEELVRLGSHLNQFRDTLGSGGSIGKKMDFIVQEINREINTVGSKANDIEITNLVISMKSELEKIREQIQNIE